MKKTLRILLVLALIFAFAAPFTAFADDTVYMQGTLLYRIEDGGITICGYVGEDEETVVVPNRIAGYPVSVVASRAFAKPGALRELDLPDTIMEIQEGAIPAGVVVVRNYNLIDEDMQGESENPAEQPSAQTGTENPTQDAASQTASGTVVQQPDSQNTGGSGATESTSSNETGTSTQTASDLPVGTTIDPSSNSNVIVTNETFLNPIVEVNNDEADDPFSTSTNSSSTAVTASPAPGTPDPNADVGPDPAPVQTKAPAPTVTPEPAETPAPTEAPAAPAAQSSSSAAPVVIVLALAACCGGWYYLRKKKDGKDA